MEAQPKNENPHRILKAIPLVVLAILILTSATSLTLAWISKNRTLDEKDIIIRVDSAVLKSVYEDEEGNVIIVDTGDPTQTSWNPDTMYPGSTIKLDIGYVNESSAAVLLSSVGVEAPAVWVNDGNCGTYASAAKTNFDEIPVQTGSNTYAYLGTQLTIRVIGHTDYKLTKQIDPETKEATYNLSNKADTVYDTPAKVSLLDLNDPTASITVKDYGTTGLSVAGEHIVVFHIIVEFENLNEPQNAFINFGSGKETFVRTVEFRLKED